MNDRAVAGGNTVMPATPADRLKAKQPRRITVGVYLDEAPADRLDAYVAALQEARRTNAPDEDQEELKAKVVEAQADLDANTIWFTFQGLGRSAFARLLADNPPTPEATAEALAKNEELPDYDPETFVQAVLVASCISPVLDEATVTEMYASPAWNFDELTALFTAAVSVNTRSRPLRVKEPT